MAIDGFWTGMMTAAVVGVTGLALLASVAGGAAAALWWSRRRPGEAVQANATHRAMNAPLAPGGSATQTSWQALYPYWAAAQATLPMAASESGGASYQGLMREVTVLCCDIRGYTTLVEQYPPHWIIQQLNEFLSAMTTILFQRQGRLDKYMGDGLLAYFEPVDGSVATSARNAAQAALMMLSELRRLNQQWASRGLPTIDIGVGLHCGQVYIGNVGSAMRMDVTILGDAVNVASRIEALNKRCGTRILVSEAVRRLIQQRFQLRALGSKAIRGKSQPEAVYELQAERLSAWGDGKSDGKAARSDARSLSPLGGELPG